MFPLYKNPFSGKGQLDSFMPRYKLLAGLVWPLLAISAFSQNYIALRIYWILWNFKLYPVFDRRIFFNREPSLTPPRSHKVSIVLLIINWVSTSFIPYWICFLLCYIRIVMPVSLWGMNEVVCLKYLAQDLANSNASVNVGYDFYTTGSAHFCWGLCPSSGEHRCSCSPVSLTV